MRSVFLSYRQMGVDQKNKVDVLSYVTNALFMLMCLLMNRGASSCLFFRAWGHMVARFAKNVSCYNHHQGQRGGPTYSLLFYAVAATAACRPTPLSPRAGAATRRAAAPVSRGCYRHTCCHSHERPTTVAVATNVLARIPPTCRRRHPRSQLPGGLAPIPVLDSKL